MTIAHNFHYHKPKASDEVLALLAQYKEKAFILSGGTDLINWLREGLVVPDALIDIKGIDQLTEITSQKDGLHIGAAVTFNTLIEADLLRASFPLIHEMVPHVASTGVRNRASMVGNICSAVPSCDSGPILLVYDAQVVIQGPDGQSRIPITEWFTGPKKTALPPNSFVTELVLPQQSAGLAGAFVKLGRYEGEDLAQANLAILASTKETRVAMGAVAPTPIRAHEIEKILSGQKLTDDVIQEAVAAVPAAIKPITDIRASREYRTHMMQVMLKRGLCAVRSRLAGKGPAYGTRFI